VVYWLSISTQIGDLERRMYYLPNSVGWGQLPSEWLKIDTSYTVCDKMTYQQ